MLTVAVPNFNGARYLDSALASLAAQRPHLRWHLQDGGSGDDSLEIARRRAGDGDALASEPDGGQAAALNTAFAACGGDILGWLNSDDQLVDGAAQAVLAAFAAHPEVDIVYGEVDWIGADGEPRGHHAGRMDSLAEALDIHRVWWAGRQWVQPEVFFRRRMFERVGGIDSGYDLAFDYDLWLRMLEAGATALRLPRTLARFRLHPGQKSARAAEAAAEIRRSAHAALARKPPLPSASRRRIARLLDYDRYQAGEILAADGTRASLPAMLARRPDWLLLPEVRRRLLRSFLARQRHALWLV